MASKDFTQTGLVSLTVGETERGRMGVMESVSTRCVVGLCLCRLLKVLFFPWRVCLRVERGQIVCLTWWYHHENHELQWCSIKQNITEFLFFFPLASRRFYACFCSGCMWVWRVLWRLIESGVKTRAKGLVMMQLVWWWCRDWKTMLPVMIKTDRQPHETHAHSLIRRPV